MHTQLAGDGVGVGVCAGVGSERAGVGGGGVEDGEGKDG